MDHTSINQIIIDIMVVFALLGAVDRIIGGRFGLWDKMEEGIGAMGALFVGMAGFISLAPVLAELLAPVVVPVYEMLGADPAMFAGTLFGIDMGGYPVALEMAQSTAAGQFAGVILASMMGVTIVFTIPFALNAVAKEDMSYLATGVLCGVITIPFGCFVGGLVAGFDMGMVLRNLVPIIIVAALIAIGLAIIPNGMIRGFEIFGKFMIIIATVGLIASIVETLTGIVLIPGMAPLSDSIATVGAIAIVLAGAYPMVEVVIKVFGKPLKAVGEKLGINEIATAGLIATLANSIPTFGFIKDMDTVGKTVNFAFMVSAAFVLGDHLGFVAGVDKTMMLPMICGKLVAGILAVVLALFIAKRQKNKQ
ncbi:MAG: ethanolamine utilization protein EutH [Butyricicoccus sp.]|nr:ethanolamine utilization protein EutH [Butyricicoccus sp.]